MELIQSMQSAVTHLASIPDITGVAVAKYIQKVLTLMQTLPVRMITLTKIVNVTGLNGVLVAQVAAMKGQEPG